MILADHQIRQLVKIEPFAEHTSAPGILSYGLGSYGYDLRLGRKFLVCRRPTVPSDYVATIDPKNFDRSLMDELEGDICTIPPNSYVLAESMEYLEIPRNITCICLGKSTYARASIVPYITPLEAGWCGKVTIEISNHSPYPALIYAGEGICQVVFFQGEHPETSYADRQGKYQHQTGLTLPIV